MAKHNRVVWDEGMMLAPQHFQQWERWIESELGGRTVAGHGHGFTALAVDPSALVGGQVALQHCAGFFPGGIAFDCPTRDPLPQPLPVLDRLDEKSGAATVYLAQPKHVDGTSYYADAADGQAPLRRARQRVVDLARPETDREITTAAMNLSLRTDRDDLTAFHTLPVAYVVRAAGGGVQLAEGHLPPALAIRAAPPVLSVLRQTLGMLTQKWTEMSGRRRGGGLADASGLLLLHTVGQAIPAIRHCIDHGGTSPEVAYLQLAQLAAQLCSFHERMSPNEVPPFQRDDAGPAIQQLGTMLQELLGDAAPVMCESLPLQREGEALFWATIPSPNMLSHGALFLSVRADASEEQIVQSLPTLTKISAKDKVQDLLMRAVPGLPIKHVPQPPTSIPTQVGRQYFRFEPAGEHWDAIGAALSVAIHVSPGLPQLDLELLSVKE